MRSLITTNDNWKDNQQTQIENSTLAPSNDMESAIVATLAPGSYTAIVAGKDGSTGVGMVELYDLDANSDSTWRTSAHAAWFRPAAMS